MNLREFDVCAGQIDGRSRGLNDFDEEGIAVHETTVFDIAEWALPVVINERERVATLRHTVGIQSA